jgi:D-tyrosyl-tRNA(Tyr) deacylase
VVQRVSRAEVRIDGEIAGAIDKGMVVLLGVAAGDTEADAEAMAAKVAKLRIFPSERRPIDASVTDVAGAALVVSQFTLCADTRKGNRPSFIAAAAPQDAERLYEHFCERLAAAGVPVETGRFAAMMDVELVNDGPVTIVL